MPRSSVDAYLDTVSLTLETMVGSQLSTTVSEGDF